MLSDKVITRENEGYDVGAWKYAMTEYLGWDYVQSYDELVLFNDSFFGPFYPFKEIFDEMDTAKVNFWGLTCQYEMENSFCGRIPTHIQSYFVSIGKEMFSSYEFKDYWENLPPMTSMEDVYKKHEAVFSQYFEERGFLWDVYVDTSCRETDAKNNYDLCKYEPYWLVKSKKLPILKKKLFSCPFSEYLDLSIGNELHRCIEYIDKHTDYDIDLIWDYILKHYNISDIFRSVGLQYVISVDQSTWATDSLLEDTLIVMHIVYVDQLDLVRDYVDNIPAKINILMTTIDEERKDRLTETFEGHGNVKIKKLRENRGRDLAALLIAARQEIKNYKYICFVHDKNTAGIPRIVSKDFQAILWENMLGSKSYIANILNMFEANPRLGLMCPPAPTYSLYTIDTDYGWGGNFNNALSLRTKLGITIPMDERKTPLSFGSTFWCKREALQPLWSYPWTHEDFPEEPLFINGQISHAIERIFCFVAQQTGYYTAWVMTPRMAIIEGRNMRYMLESIKHQESSIDEKPSKNSYDHFFPYHIFKQGDRILLYGAGNIGKQFYRQAMHDNYVDIVGIVDKSAENIHSTDIFVQPIEAIKAIEFDYILITMNRPMVADSAKRDILAMGVEENKIKWDGEVYYRDHFYQKFYYRMMDKFNPNRDFYEGLLKSEKEGEEKK